MSDTTVIDLEQMGLSLKAARQLAKFRRVEDVRNALASRGEPISLTTLYALERGERAPTLAQMCQLMVVLQPPGGFAFFLPCFREDVQDAMTKRMPRHPLADNPRYWPEDD